MFDDDETVAPVIPLNEVRALIAYASDRALDVPSPVFEELERAVYEFETAADDQARFTANQAIRSGYSKLSKITYPEARVTGRSLIDTPKVREKTKGIMGYSIVFFVLAAISQILSLYVADQPAPEDGSIQWHITFINDYFFNVLNPLFWGGLGASVYLLKRVSDLAEGQAFDSRLLHGWRTRIWIGAILGATIAYIYEPDAFSSSDDPLAITAIAFLTGLSVKVVYGGLEKTVDALAKSMNLESLKTRRPRRANPDQDGNAGG